MTAWDAYVGAVIRIEAPGDVVWVRLAAELERRGLTWWPATGWTAERNQHA